MNCLVLHAAFLAKFLFSFDVAAFQWDLINNHKFMPVPLYLRGFLYGFIDDLWLLWLGRFNFHGGALLFEAGVDGTPMVGVDELLIDVELSS